jgi:hypothetical protein
LSEQLISEGYPVEFVILSDQNATDFSALVPFSIFRDASPGRPAWVQMDAGAVKHDTFVYDKTGARTLFWDASMNSFATLTADLRAAVEAIGR